MDQFRRNRKNVQKKLEEVETSLMEATRQLDDLNQRLSDPSLYLDRKELTIRFKPSVKRRRSRHFDAILGVSGPGDGTDERKQDGSNY